MKFRPSAAGNRLWLMLFTLVIFAGWLPAQSTPGRLRGLVTDPSGAVIPGAAVSVKNGSGLSIAVKSDGAGNYDVKSLGPGKYSVTVTAKGFRSVVQEVEIVAGQDKKVDFPLEILAQEEKVEVDSEAAKVSVNPDNNASTMVISGKDLDALSDDPDELQSELQALAGPSSGPNGGQIYIDGFTGGQLPPKSSILEIRINQNPFSAQYDRMGFGRIEIRTKPGTDKPHGQFFYNDNHSIFDAMNPFGGAEPDFSSEIVSANMGGPLSKKASYFVNFERRNIHDAAVINADAFNQAGLNPVPVLNPRIRTSAGVRFDYQLAANNTLMVRYQYSHNNEENDGVSQQSLPSQAYNQTSFESTLQISDTQLFGPHVINETRFEWERGGQDQDSLNFTPTINVLGSFIEGGNPLGVSSQQSDHYELQNYTSVNLANNFLRLGGRLRVTALTNTSTRNFNGTYTFTTVNAFNAGTPSQLLLVVGNPTISDTAVDAGLYGEDDWKIRQNMTLSAGLRFETQNGISDHADWAPRLGFAWGVGGKKNAQPKTVIRAGFGIFYDRFAQSLIMNAKELNGINQQQFTFSNLTPAGQTCLAAYPNPMAASCPRSSANTTTYSIDQNLRAPYIIQTVGSLERQLTKTSTITASYIHSRGVHQLFSVNSNALVFGATPANVYVSEGDFNQNQLLTNFNMRVGAKLTITSFYSLSFANGDTSGAGSFPSNPALGITADYGRTGFDVRNRLFLIGTYALPHGFRVSPFMITNSGAPFNITLGQDLNGDSIFNDRPAFASSSTLPVNLRQTPWGDFDLAPGASHIPINLGTSPAQFTLNLRVSKTFGIGPKLQTLAASGPGNGPQGNGQQSNGQQGGGQKGGGEGGRGPGGGGGGRGPGGPGGGGPQGGPGGGPRGMVGGPFGGGGGERSADHRYSLTFSANARNLFNNVNGNPPIGNITSSKFGLSTALAQGPFNTQSANRRLDFQVMFAF